MLRTRNTEVNKRGEVWALRPAPQGDGWDGMQTADREGITQISGLQAMMGKQDGGLNRKG